MERKLVCMTSNQIRYNELKETIRKDQMSEAQRQAELSQKEKQQWADLQEEIRHNMTEEQIRNLLAAIESGKLKLEGDRLDFDKSKWAQQNQRSWAELIGNWAYTFFSKMPKDATEGFANFGKGVAGVLAL